MPRIAALGLACRVIVIAKLQTHTVFRPTSSIWGSGLLVYFGFGSGSAGFGVLGFGFKVWVLEDWVLASGALGFRVIMWLG